MSNDRQILDYGGIPGTDYKSLEWWAANFGRSQEFVRKHCDELGVSYLRFGDVVFYSAAHMLDAMPVLTKEIDHTRKPGGRSGRAAT